MPHLHQAAGELLDTTIGGSDVVSEPMRCRCRSAPVAILAAMTMAACSDVPQACCSVMPGVDGASLVAEHRFAREVPVLRVRDDRAADDLVDVRAVKLVLVDQAVERRRHHVEVRLVGIERVRAAERNARCHRRWRLCEGSGSWGSSSMQVQAPNVLSIVG